MSLYASAYNIWPSESVQREEFNAELFARDWVCGIELGYGDSVEWPAGVPDDVVALVSGVPGTTFHNATDPDFGLGSRVEEGRQRALEWARGVAAGVRELAATGHRVRAVQLHSAPTGKASKSAFLASLTELVGLDWGGAQLWIEHCDAWIEGQTPNKGYLGLDEELEVLDELKIACPGAGWGMVINWARSAIEGRDDATSLAHIKRAADAGWLRHVGFSSCSPQETAFGVSWVDAHLPFAGTSVAPTGTLLTAGIIGECRAACGENITLGLKLGIRPVDQPNQVVLGVLDEHSQMILNGKD